MEPLPTGASRPWRRDHTPAPQQPVSKESKSIPGDEVHLMGKVDGQGVGVAGALVSAALKATKSRHRMCWSMTLTRLVLLQFFAILEANYPETLKNLIVIRGEPMMGMTPWGRRSGEWGETVGKSPSLGILKPSFVEIRGFLFC